MSDTSLRVGDTVRVSAHGTTKEAVVVVASQNGRSIAVEFDGGLFWPSAAGAYVGFMPLLQQDDGTWIELINQTPITVTREDA
jgi:hypothetical protein